jgi:hypothetical protein
VLQKESTLDLRLGANTRSCRGLDCGRLYGPSCRPTLGHFSAVCFARSRNAVDLLVASSIIEICSDLGGKGLSAGKSRGFCNKRRSVVVGMGRFVNEKRRAARFRTAHARRPCRCTSRTTTCVPRRRPRSARCMGPPSGSLGEQSWSLRSCCFSSYQHHDRRGLLSCFPSAFVPTGCCPNYATLA